LLVYIYEDIIEKGQEEEYGCYNKNIIINLELDEEYNKITDKYGGPSREAKREITKYYKESHNFLRQDVSLPEIIAGKLFPKGRMSISVNQYEGYEEAKKEADKLNASYSRTLKRMIELNLLNIGHANNFYMITDKGKEILKDKC